MQGTLPPLLRCLAGGLGGAVRAVAWGRGPAQVPPRGEHVCKRQTGRLSDVPVKTES